MLLRIARLALLLLITTVVIWALVLGWWQSSGHAPSKSESLLYLIALPLAIVGGFLLLNGFIHGLRNPPESKAADTAKEGPAPVEHTDAAERQLQLSIVAHALMTAAGNDAPSVIAAAGEGKAPKPDDELKDDDGFPVFAARTTGLDVATFTESISPFAQTQDWANGLRRSLALADQVLAELLVTVHETIDAHPAVSPELRLDWIMDRPLEAPTREALTRWLHETHLSAFASTPFQTNLHTATDDVSALQLIDSLALGLNREETPTIAIVLTSASNLDEAQVARWQAERHLFTAQHQVGQIPGEAAAGIALVTTQTANRFGLESGPQVSRFNIHHRDKPADAGGKISAALCAQLCVDLLRVFAIEPSAVAALTSDCDHRATRQAEALGVIDESFEALEPSQDYAPLGSVCGSASPASALVALICAAETAVEKNAPVLALSVQHPTLRAAALLQVPPPSESTL